MSKKVTNLTQDKDAFIKVDGGSFHKASVAAYKTEKDFLDAANDKANEGQKDKTKHTNHKMGWFEGVEEPDRTTKLKAVYAMATAKPASPAPEAKS